MRNECPLCGESLRWKFLVGEPHPSHHYICPFCNGKIQRRDLAEGVRRHRWTFAFLLGAIVLIWVFSVPGNAALTAVALPLVILEAARWYRERNLNFWLPYVQ